MRGEKPLMDLNTAFRILQLNRRATPRDVKRAYRTLASKWHPDRFPDDRKRRQLAQKKMQALNSAYSLAMQQLETGRQEARSPCTIFSAPLPVKHRFWTHLFLGLLVCGLVLTLAMKFMVPSPAEHPSPERTHSSPGHSFTDNAATLWLKAERFNHFPRSALKTVQRNLTRLGYDVGQPDGFFGPRTMSALRLFVNDFGPVAAMHTPKDILEALTLHVRVADAHPQWRTIVGLQTFHRWLEDHSFSETSVQSGSDAKSNLLIQLTDQYLFSTSTPPPLPLPATGILWKKSQEPTMDSLLLTGAPRAGVHCLIKMVDGTNGEELVYGFVRAGEVLEVPCPETSCLLKLAGGSHWYGKNFLFGPETIHAQARIAGNNAQSSPAQRRIDLAAHLSGHNHRKTTRSVFTF